MKKLIFITALVSLTACSTSRLPSSKLNCERLQTDSEAKIAELHKVFNAYQDLNVDLAVKLSPPFKEEMAQMDERLKKQKQKCWPGEAKAVDENFAELKDNVVKVYGDLPPREPKKTRLPSNEYFVPGRGMPASEVTAAPAPAPTPAAPPPQWRIEPPPAAVSPAPAAPTAPAANDDSEF